MELREARCDDGNVMASHATSSIGHRARRSERHVSHHRISRGLRILGIVLAVILFLLLAVRWIGSPVATSIVNKKLAALPGYPGHIASLQLSLWRGKVTATDLTLVQSGHEDDGPVLRVQHGAFTLAPIALLRGKISGRVAVNDVDVVFIEDQPAASKGDTKDEKKLKAEKRNAGSHAWASMIQEKFPIDMTRFEISNLKVKFVDRARALQPQLLLEKVHLVAHDFRTKPASAGDLPAKLEVTGSFPGGGTLTANAAADTNATQPQFKTTMEVKDLALPPMHDFLQSYANVDVKRGTFQLYVEVNAEGGHYDGYLKPFFENLEFKSVPDPEKSLTQRAVTKIASAAQNLLKNDQGQVATKAPFKGDFANNKVDLWTTIQNLLRNAFITSLRQGFEGQKPNG